MSRPSLLTLEQVKVGDCLQLRYDLTPNWHAGSVCVIRSLIGYATVVEVVFFDGSVGHLEVGHFELLDQTP